MMSFVARFRIIALAGVLSSSIFAGACDSKTVLNDGGAVAAVTFTPRCGSPGDIVTITLARQPDSVREITCTGVRATFHPGVRAESTNTGGLLQGGDCTLAATVPVGARTGTIQVRPDDGFDLTWTSTDVFTIPCPADAGPEGGSDAGTGGLAIEVELPKPDGSTGTVGQVKQTSAGKVLITGNAADATLTEVDPATGAVTRQFVAGVSVNAALRDASGLLIVGRSGVDAMAAHVSPTNQVDWAIRFGGGLERAVDAVVRNANLFLIAYAASVLQVSNTGTGATNLSFDTPPSTRVQRIAMGPSDTWAAATEMQGTFPEQDLGVIGMASNGAVAWQKRFANGYRNFITSFTWLANGGYLLTGAHWPASTTVQPFGFAILVGPNGAVLWQRMYGTEGAVKISSAVQTTSGFRLAGSSEGKLAAFEVGPDGAVLSAVRYEMPTGQALGAGTTPSGELLLTGYTPLGATYQVLKANPDLTLACGPMPFAVPVMVTSAATALNVTDTTFTATWTPVMPTPITTVVPGAVQPVTPVNKCGN